MGINKKILLVDDEPDILKVVIFRLKACSYEVMTASDGIKALEAVEKEKPSLIMLDVNMPVMDGIQTLEKLKSNGETKDIPVIMLTAKTQSQDIEKAINLGANDYISKPFEHIVLLNKIKEILG